MNTFYTTILMKNFWLLSFTLLVQLCYSQKNYDFDYILNFDKSISIKKNKEKDSAKTFLVNSSKNGYMMVVNNRDSSKYGILFIDNDGILINSTINKNSLNTAEKITTDCKNVKPFSNPFKFQVNNYEFVNLTDTIINNTSYYHYYIKSNRSLKYQKRKKIVAIHYIVDKKSPEFLPFLIHYTCYEEWKKERNIPNGSPYIIYHKNIKGEITYKIQLKSLVKVTKYLAVPDECDYTKIE